MTTLFVCFEGIDYDGDVLAGAKLQEYLTAAIRVVDGYDGYFSRG